MSLPDRIKSSRQAASLGQAKVAEALGVTVQAVSQWETGKNEPSLLNLIAVANLLNVSLQWLSTGKEDVDSIDNADGKVPLVTWDGLYKFIVLKDHTALFDIQPTRLLVSTREENNFSLLAAEIIDDSMKPEIIPEDIIIVDLELLPEPGDFVLVSLEGEARVYLRRYVFGKSATGEPVVQFRPSNDIYPEFSTEGLVVPMLCGVVIEQRRLRPHFKRRSRRNQD